MSFNPWHHVSIGEDVPKIVRAIVEISRGSKAKYELDKETGMLRLDRVLYSSAFYPTNYGFIPRTLGDDHDPLDILVLSQVEIEPLCIVRAKVIGVMRMIDSGEGDDKVIAVALDDVSVNHINSVSELPEYLSRETRNFFEQYKTLENKTILVDEFQDIDVAYDIINKAMLNYANSFSK